MFDEDITFLGMMTASAFGIACGLIIQKVWWRDYPDSTYFRSNILKQLRYLFPWRWTVVIVLFFVSMAVGSLVSQIQKGI
ncbi:hypothetical protein ATO4_00655 [Aurantimonas sp. 22II-16-19i]|nr:hypothetical protein ATO4_00655 [Aurantimonas sp. 22II-16-19i]